MGYSEETYCLLDTTPLLISMRITGGHFALST